MGSFQSKLIISLISACTSWQAVYNISCLFLHFVQSGGINKLDFGIAHDDVHFHSKLANIETQCQANLNIK